MNILKEYTSVLQFLRKPIYIYFVFAFVWLISCQVGFFFLQKNLSIKTVEALQNQLRQELDYSNFQYLSRSINDFQKSGAIRCATLKIVAPSKMEILDLRYMSDESSCKDRDWFLSGAHTTTELNSLNGDTYSFDFINENGSIFTIALWSFRIFGVLLIAMAYRNLLFRINIEAERTAIEVQHAKEIADLSSRVAHDIRSPLSVLNSLAKGISSLKDEDKDIINAVVGRINGIAEDLLKQRKRELTTFSLNKNPSSVLESCHLETVLNEIVEEKKIEYKGDSRVQIFLRANPASKDTYVQVSSTTLARCISNLINNSIEAIREDGSIYLETDTRDKFATIILTDFGKGIPEESLERVMNSSYSYGKENSKSGNGIGISSAIAEVRKVSGSLEIKSRVDVGTQVIIRIPLTT